MIGDGDSLDNLKEIRWKQRFQNFERSYKLLEKYISKEDKNELEKAGVIQFFEMTFELSWKLLKDYLEDVGYKVNSPRETIKQSYQIELIDQGHVWIDALMDRNLATHTYNDEMAEKMLKDISERYFPQLKNLYEKLKKEI